MISISCRHLVWICCAIVIASAVFGQEHESPHVTVTGENESEHDQFTELGEYAQPAWAERSRLSSTTSVYVLSPYEVFVGNIWEGDFPRHRNSAHDFVQEIDVGLLHRFELGLENELGLAGGDAHETAATLEARYAFANWNAILLNPAISLEYIFGVGKSVKTLHRQPNAVALRLLLGQNFGDHFGYGLNFALQQDVSHDSGREFEIAQAITYGMMKGKLELGAESRYTHMTGRARLDEQDELLIGPSLGWKPTRQIRVGLSPLFGCTDDSPRVSLFFLVSYEFGGAEAVVAPIPRD